MGKTIKSTNTRDLNIDLHLKGEISLSTKIVTSKKNYSRKQKHRNKDFH